MLKYYNISEGAGAALSCDVMNAGTGHITQAVVGPLERCLLDL